MAQAVANVRLRVGTLSLVRLGSDDGASGLGAATGLAPSILVEPDMCGPAAPSGLRGQIILVYARDMFLFTLPADGAMTKRFWRVVNEEIAGGRSLSSTPLTCRDGHWVVAAQK